MIDRRTASMTLFAGVVATNLGPVGEAVRAQGAPGGRRAEVEALRLFAEQTHPRGPEASQSAAWQAIVERLAKGADGMSHAGYVTELVRMLSWFEDGHTMVETFRYEHGPFAYRLPLGVEASFDGLLVTRVRREAESLLGCRLTRVGSLPAGDLVRRFAELWRSDNLAYSHRMTQVLFRSPGLLHGLGAVSGSDDTPIRIEAVNPRGRTVKVMVRPKRAAQPTSLHGSAGDDGWQKVDWPLSPGEKFATTQDHANFVWVNQDRRALYINLQTLEPDPAFDRLFLAAEEALRQPFVERVIIDLRRNNGGNNDAGEPLRKLLTRSTFNRPGGIYVLTAPVTFSAAQNLATRIERETYALFVGEPTGGRPNHYGDAKSFVGSVTGVQARVSSLPWFDSSPFDKRPWIFPDLFVPMLWPDRIAGVDRALEAALSHTDDRRNDDRTRTFRWRRPSQRGEWKPFWLT